MRKGIHLFNLKNQQRSCHRTNFNSIFNISSYRNPKIQNDLPSKNHQSQVDLLFFSPKL